MRNKNPENKNQDEPEVKTSEKLSSVNLKNKEKNPGFVLTGLDFFLKYTYLFYIYGYIYERIF